MRLMERSSAILDRHSTEADATSMLRPTLLIVGAFPPPNSEIVGGVLTACRSLLQSTFPDHFDLILVDSTQRSNPPPGLLKRALVALKRSAGYLRLLLAKRPDGVLLFCSSGGSLAEKGAMAWLARILCVPTLIFPRAGKLMDDAARSTLHRLWTRALLRGATHFLCQGPRWRRFAVEVIGFSPQRTQIVPNWTADAELLKIGRRRLSEDPASTSRLLFLGWLEEAKGIFQLLDACERLAKDHMFQLTVAGRGSAEATARERVEGSSISDRVEFAGWVERGGLATLLARCDILVLPSWSEGLPNAVIEAHAAGVAAIASDVGSVPDVIQHAKTGLLVPAKDVGALEVAIRTLLTDPELRRRLAVNGHRLAARYFSADAAVPTLSAFVMDAVLSGKGNTRRTPRSVAGR